MGGVVGLGGGGLSVCVHNYVYQLVLLCLCCNFHLHQPPVQGLQIIGHSLHLHQSPAQGTQLFGHSFHLLQTPVQGTELFGRPLQLHQPSTQGTEQETDQESILEQENNI